MPKNTSPWIESVLRWLLPIIYAAIIFFPAYIFFTTRGGFEFLSGASFKTANALLFPLAGLYAFFLIWAQIMIGSNMHALRRVYTWIEIFHRAQGGFAFLFALAHPVLLFLGVGPDLFFGFRFVDPRLVFFAWLGYFQLFLIMLTVGTAALMKLPWLKTRWHYIHYLNYLLFASVWIHSWFLGSDVQATDLKYLWFFCGATAVISFIARIARPFIQKKKTMLRGQGVSPGTFFKAANVTDVKSDTPLCVELQGKKIALFNIMGKMYAIDNTCSHAGGPLCEGKLDGSVVECPWHGSKFEVTTGEVKAGPARTPQATYEVRVVDNSVEVKL